MSGSAIPIAAFTATGFLSGDVTKDAQGDLFIYSGFGASGSTVAGAVYEIANTATGYAATPALIASLGDDGSIPGGALSIDANGDLFGVSNSVNGAIFEIAHTATGYADTPAVLASLDGLNLNGPPVEDAKGDLFGTAYGFTANGQPGGGEIFELVSTATGYASTPTVLAQFNGVDGYEPGAGLVMDANGDLFGTTEQGPGSQAGNEIDLTGQGEVFELQNSATGYASTPSILLAFNGDNGAMPLSQLLLDANGNLYGDTYIGGVDAITGDPTSNPDTGGGVVVAIPDATTGGTQANEVYFHGEPQTGPGSNLVEDAAGDLFGITTAQTGAIFEIQNTATGLARTPILLANLVGSAGSIANWTLLADANGDLIGSTTSGGANGDGAVFELVNTGFFIRPISIAGTEADQSTSDQTPIAPFTGVTIDDPNPDQTEIVAVTPSSTANGTLVDPNAATATIDQGVWTVTGSLAAVTVDLQALQFQPTTTGVAYGQTLTTGFTVAVADSDGQAADDTKTSVVATAMAPTQPVAGFDGPNGALPDSGGLIENAAGDLLGVTGAGGSTWVGGFTGDGTVFEILNTPTGYAATPTTIASFTGPNGDGPIGGLTQDAKGDLFGTVAQGGANGAAQGGYGTVYEIANTATGYAGTITTLVNFNNTDGRLSHATLLIDADGDLFGTTYAGATGGTVFEVRNTATGYASTPLTLVTFDVTDGSAPDSGLVADAQGDLFGTTLAGGAHGGGTVYEVKKTGSVYASTPIVLANFTGSAATGPIGGLAIDANGDLFGSTSGGGTNSDGTIFEIQNTATGYAATPAVLVNLSVADGFYIEDGLVLDANGDLLGTTEEGGLAGRQGGGTVFEVPNTGTGYASTPIVLISLDKTTGYSSVAPLLVAANGDIFGTAGLGGPDGDGSVFEVGSTGVTAAPPSITGTESNQPVSDLASVNPFASVGIGDPNPGQIETVTVTESNPANGTLADPNAASDGGAAANGAWTFTGSPLAVTQHLQGLVFHPTPVDASLGTTVTTGFTIAVTNTLGLTASDMTTSVDATTSVPSNVLYSFNEAAGYGWGQLARDAVGNIFVTATYGGEGFNSANAQAGSGDGSILEFAWTGTGYAATPTLLTEFDGSDGANPAGTLLVDAAGDLFGATSDGGTSGNGTLFEIQKIGNGYASTPTVLVNFNGTDGQSPNGSLIEDANGDLFGVTYSGGPGYTGSAFTGDGTVFELVKNGATYAATPKTLATFSGPGALAPESGLVADANGDLFGVTTFGGADESGEVYEIVNTATGYDSTPQAVPNFDGTDGKTPQYDLRIDANGDLFGTTLFGSPSEAAPFNGTVFEIVNTPTGYGSTPTVIYFNNGADANPDGPVIADAAGDLFGVVDPDAADVGAGQGAVYEIQNTPAGLSATPTILLSLGGNVGSDPVGPLIDDPDGDLVGVATSGGANGDGTLFELPSVVVNPPSSGNGLLNLDLQQNQTVSLDELSLNPAVTANGTLQTVDLGDGTATVSSIVNAFTIESDGGALIINHGAVVNAFTIEMDLGSLMLDGGSLLTDPVTVGADGDISGYGTVTGAMTNTGTVIATGGVLDVTGSITGAGTLTIENGATLELGSGVGPQQIVQFDTSAVTGSATLLLDDPIGFAGTIGPVVAGDSIALTPSDAVLNAASLGASGHILTLSGSLVGGSVGTLGTVTFTGTLASNDFSVGNNTVTLTEIPAEVACFLPGTLIDTEHGEIPVERLKVGDKVRTLGGGLRPIKWIGTGTALATRGRRNAATPVIVQKGAIGDNLPHHDLRVTKGHALFLDDVLIPVEFLVNHRSLRWDDRAQEVQVFHIELDVHDVLLANGVAAESYRDDGNRWLFRNGNSGWDLPPKEACAPVLTGGPVVDAVWRRLLDRARPRPGLPLTDDPDVHLLADGRRVDGSIKASSYYTFDLPHRPRDVRVVSRAASPSELGLARDPRVLGVAVRRLRLWQGARLRMMDAADESLAEGFHAYEPANLFRWTDGDAALPESLFTDITGACRLELLISGAMRYPLSVPPARFVRAKTGAA